MEPASSGCGFFSTLHEVQHTRSVAPLSPSLAPNQVGNTRATSRGVVDTAITSPAVRKRMTGKHVLDAFGASGFLSSATNHLGWRGSVLDTKFGPRYDVTAFCPHQNSTGRLRRKCVAGMSSPSRQRAHFVLFQNHFPQCFHRKLASSCLHAVDSGTPVWIVVV